MSNPRPPTYPMPKRQTRDGGLPVGPQRGASIRRRTYYFDSKAVAHKWWERLISDPEHYHTPAVPELVDFLLADGTRCPQWVVDAEIRKYPSEVEQQEVSNGK